MADRSIAIRGNGTCHHAKSMNREQALREQPGPRFHRHQTPPNGDACYNRRKRGPRPADPFNPGLRSGAARSRRAPAPNPATRAGSSSPAEQALIGDHQIHRHRHRDFRRAGPVTQLPPGCRPSLVRGHVPVTAGGRRPGARPRRPPPLGPSAAGRSTWAMASGAGRNRDGAFGFGPHRPVHDGRGGIQPVGDLLGGRP